VSETIVAADLPLPKPVKPRSYACAEYKLIKLRDCPLDSGSAVDTAERVYSFWTQHIPKAQWFRDEQETFVVFFLSTRRHMTGFNLVTIGTLDSVLVHPREVFRLAIVASAHAIVLAHNHPSGDPTPSEADIKVTRDLIRGGQLLKIEVLDHVIVGRPSQVKPVPFVSLREQGYFFT
jgi:DNA repair protein RadC